jgi:hypothetical protein
VETAQVLIAARTGFEVPAPVARYTLFKGIVHMFENAESNWTQGVKWADALRICQDVPIGVRELLVDGIQRTVSREGNRVSWCEGDGRYVYFKIGNGVQEDDAVVVEGYRFSPVNAWRELTYDA